MTTLKETNKKIVHKTPYHNKTFATPGLKSGRLSGRFSKRSDVKVPPALPNFNCDTPFVRTTRRSSVESQLSIFSSVSSSTDKPAEPENPIQHLQLEPTLTNLGFSPIIRRHVEQLEVRLGEKMQSILNTINGPVATPQVQPRKEIVSSTPKATHNQEFPWVFFIVFQFSMGKFSDTFNKKPSN